MRWLGMFYRGVVRVVGTGPPHPCVHVSFGDVCPEGIGAWLDLPSPDAIIEAARLTRRRCPWVVHAIDRLPASEHRAASFATRLARATGGVVFVVAASDSRRTDRIVGHLLTSGAEDRRVDYLPHRRTP